MNAIVFLSLVCLTESFKINSLMGYGHKNEGFGNQCWTSGNGNGPRWWPDGEIIERGSLVFRCSGGRLQPYGCRSKSSGRQLRIGETEMVDETQYTCAQVGDNAEMQITGCVQDGKSYRDGESWDDMKTNEWYTCKRSANGYFLSTQLSGCFYNGERLNFGDRRVGETCWMECQHDYSGAAKMSVCGCKSKNGGKNSEIGDTFDSEDGHFTQYCGMDEGKSQCESVTVGCKYNHQRLNDGDRYFKDKMIYQCEVRPDSFKHKVTGCVQTDRYGNTIERLINCRWYDNDGTHEYEVTCKQDEDTTEAYVRPEACIYMKGGIPTLYLLPDTYTIYWTTEKENMGVMCKRVSKTELRIEEFSPEQVHMRAAGLKYDSPRGKK